MNVVSVKSPSEPTRKLRQKTPLLGTVLHALLQLIPRHPTIFRPFSSQIHSLILPFVGSIPSVSHPDAEAVISLSQQLFISLHHCAPKNTSADEWGVACKSTVHSIHATADHLFRAVVEQWESTDATRNQTPKPQNRVGIISYEGPDPLGLPRWQGLQAGAQRLRSLLKLLAQFISTGTNSAVSAPLGLVVDLTSRLNSLTVPFEDADGLQNAIQYNPEIAKDEREDLLSELPAIHSETLNLLSSIAETFEDGIAPVAQHILEQTLWVFEAESFSKDVRTSTYHLLSNLLPILGPSISTSTMSSVIPAIQSCCYDLCPPPTAGNSDEHHNSESKAKPVVRPTSTNADSFLSTKLRDSSVAKVLELAPGLAAAASRLLPSLLHYLPVEHISTQLRAEIDRTAILTNNRKAMVASVINPGLAVKGRRENPSIAPFLARSYPSEFEVESFLRPRMPILLRGSIVGGKLFDARESEAESESAVPNHTATSHNMFMATSSLSSTALLNQEPEKVSTDSNKRSYPTDSESSTVKTQSLSIVKDHDSEAPQAKTPRFANGHARHEELQKDLDSAFPGSSKSSTYPSGAQPLPANPSSIANTSYSIAPPDAAASNVDITQVGSSAVDSSRNRVADAMSVVKEPAGVFTGTSTGVGASSGSTSHGAGNDSSGDEIPTLDIEPDTDEEDEDTEMGG